MGKNKIFHLKFFLFISFRYRRVVSYTADDHHGFQANVQREPWTGEGHKVVAKVIQPQITKVIQPAVVQKVISAPSHGWQQPQAAWKPPTHGWQAAPQHGWQAPNPHANNPWG